jgi:hypothetical protein
MTTTIPTSPQTGRRRPRVRPATPRRARADRHAAAIPSPLETDSDVGYLPSSSPMRPPDWHYRRALVLAKRRGCDPELLCTPGPLIRVAPYWIEEEPPPGAILPYKEALAIYQGPDEPIRATLQAHLLARRSPDEAARAMGLPPAVVRSYAHLFFDVAGRLDCSGYIAGHVFHAPHRPEARLGYILRVVACSGGPLALDDMLHAFGLGHLAGSPAYVSSDPVFQDLCRRTLVATLLMSAAPHCGHAARELDQRYRRVQALEHDPERHHKAEIKVMRAVIRRVRRAFGVAVRDNPFLAAVLAV